MSDQIESQIERFAAPVFRDCILARHTVAAADLGKSNPNLAGGDNQRRRSEPAPS